MKMLKVRGPARPMYLSFPFLDRIRFFHQYIFRFSGLQEIG